MILSSNLKKMILEKNGKILKSVYVKTQKSIERLEKKGYRLGEN